MAQQPLERVVRNIDKRLEKVEKILPTLATKEELRTRIAEAIAPLATKAELAEAIAPLGTKAELHEEGERTRRHFDVVAQRLEGKIEIVAEGLVVLRESVDRRFEGVDADITGLDRRVTKLEARRRTTS